ncbi:hypothetical protein [uncultured Jatrophihabitans sp.]|uniref:DUF7674 family protein n=1 Tax=uncultured Jatrophihabitans sp. TaxID=1610747 RepID=UPI0035CBA447
MPDGEYRASEVNQRFCRLTTKVAPALTSVLAEHLDDNLSEMLPHLYFGDVSRWFIDQTTAHGPSTEAARLLDLLETSYPTADEDVQNLIDVSFVEMVQDEPKVVALFGPNLLSRVDPEFLPS